jgi:hypothetical protein
MNDSTLKSFLRIRAITGIVSLLYLFILSCSNNGSSITEQSSAIKDSVQKMVESIARDVSNDGPVAWLHYFEKTPGFFMASGGQLVFPDNDSATGFINNTLVRTITKIKLKWNNVRIDTLSNIYASVAANFEEELTDSAGKKIEAIGFFTGIAHHTAGNWKLMNAHWSIANEK